MYDALLSYAMLSDPGRVRRGNEDACAADLGHGVFVVCDAVGGAAGGEVASQLAAQSFLAAMIAAREAKVPHQTAIPSGVEDANRTVRSRSHDQPELYGMATTMVAMIFDPVGDLVAEPLEDGANFAGTVWLANVGDSRCYRVRRGELEQLTHDHSIVEEQVRSGAMTREQADTSPIRNVITRAIGSEAGVQADVHDLAAWHGDLYLLASDGLTRDLSVAQVGSLLRGMKGASETLDDARLAAACAELVAAANERGGGDNITCLLVQVR